MFGESKVIRLLSIIHNGIILDLVCGFGGVVFGEGVRPDSSSVWGEKSLSFYLKERRRETWRLSVRSGDSGGDSPEVHGPRGWIIGPGRVVDKGDELSCA